MRTRSGDSTVTNSTFALLGNIWWFSMTGPRTSTAIASGSSDEQHGMRIAHRQTGGLDDLVGQLDLGVEGVGSLPANGYPGRQEDRGPHVDPHATILEDPHPLDAGTGVHLDLGGIDQALFAGEYGQASDPVAAHLAQGPVGIDVVHEQRGTARARGDAQDAVSPDAEMAIAQATHEFPGHAQLVLRVGDHDEVVPDAVIFGESHISRLRPKSRAGRQPLPPQRQAAPRRTTRPRGSARNHDSCRRAKRLVARTIASRNSCCDAPGESRI